MSYRERHPEVHQEEDHVPPGKVIFAIVVVFVVSAALIAWSYALVRDAFAEYRPSGAFPERALGERRPIARVREDLFDERGLSPTSNAARRAELGSFGWVDRRRGIVRIPVDRAIDLMLQEKR